MSLSLMFKFDVCWWSDYFPRAILGCWDVAGGGCLWQLYV